MKRGDTEETFMEAIGKLNSTQREAVDAIEGPVMVIAGPGTGKTQIIALRIANILNKTDTKPENILALTFTDAGAHAMKERLRRYIGDAAYRVPVHTFHSFAGQLIAKYPDAYPNIIGGRPSTDIERLGIIESIINSGGFSRLRPHGDPLYYVKKIPNAITDLKKEYVTPDILQERINQLETKLEQEPKFHEKGAHKGKVRSAYAEMEKRINKLRELALVYRQYQSVLKDRRLFDFEDMILETIDALRKNEDMLLDLQETYQYILADEHQDVNAAQNQILELLASYHEQPNLFVVGDEKQAIYRFQGASLDNFLFFESHYADTKVISLTDNYRSTQQILDTAHSLVETDNETLRTLRLQLSASGTTTSGNLPEFRQFSHEAVEDDWIVSEVKKVIESGVPLSEIAIIVRYNRDVENLSTLLRRHNIDVNPSADSDILEHPITRAVESLLSASSKADEEGLFEVLIGGWWGIAAGDIARVLSARSRIWPLHRIIADEEKLRSLSIENYEAILKVSRILEEAREKSSTTPPHLVLQFLIEESGLLDQVMKNDPLESVRILRRIYDEVEEMVVSNRNTTLLSVSNELQYRRFHGLALIAPFINHDKSAVNVMTAHKSKGLEFHTVFIARAHDEAFGKATHRDIFKLPLAIHDLIPDFGPEDDDRRLLYVAMTRAKERLSISMSESDKSGKLREPSRLLSSIDGKLLKSISTEQENDGFRPEAGLSLSLSPLRLESNLIKEIFINRGLSVTHLNNYLEDPLKYYYENLLRKPHPRSLSLLKGEAVHEVLERAVESYLTTGEKPKDKAISDYLKHALEKLPLSLHDEVSIHEKTFATISVYLPTLWSQLNKKTQTELSINVVLKTNDPDLPEIPLTGKLDRVDLDEAGLIQKVTDYKTGKPKSKNEIEGLTKNSSGSYKRQLVFYALLLKLYNEDQSISPVFNLSFVEPKEKTGEVIEYEFSITNDEIAELKETILRVSKEIISGEKFGV